MWHSKSLVREESRNMFDPVVGTTKDFAARRKVKRWLIVENVCIKSIRKQPFRSLSLEIYRYSWRRQH
jgi:hypothetical protein